MRITVTTTPVHTDKTSTNCTHPRPGRKPCPGTSGYRSRCSACTWRRAGRDRGALEQLAAEHLTTHLTVPATS